MASYTTRGPSLLHSQQSTNAAIIAAPSLASAAEIHLSTSCLPSSNLANCSRAQLGWPVTATNIEI